MPGPSSPGIPPEVPEEFTDAYRAAYEAALSQQSVPPGSGNHSAVEPLQDDEAGLPLRTRPIRLGTHRSGGGEVGQHPSAFGRVRDSRSFVPVLLLLLGLLLVVGAYALGLVFAARVGG
jgi:hypothetical protein